MQTIQYFRVGTSSRPLAFIREASRLSDDLWFRYSSEDRVAVTIPQGFDLEPLDQIALRHNLMLASVGG